MDIPWCRKWNLKKLPGSSWHCPTPRFQSLPEPPELHCLSSSAGAHWVSLLQTSLQVEILETLFQVRRRATYSRYQAQSTKIQWGLSELSYIAQEGTSPLGECKIGNPCSKTSVDQSPPGSLTDFMSKNYGRESCNWLRS